MMETILSFIATAVGELLDWLVEAFLGAMNLSLSDMVLTFPFLVDGYKMFRSIGIGLILCIAIWNLLKFFGGQIADTKDTPIQLLLRAFIAGGLLWFGGYILELTVDLAKIPFDTFVQADAVTVDFQGIVENFADFAWFGDAAATLAIGGGTMLLISLILILLIGWNVLKLMVEVCERYLMIAVLVYSSPLIYPTITSSSTAQIFKKWCGMFFGQCALMTLSAWMLKLICSGFSFTTSTHNVMFRLMLTLAMCKIAQRVDTYMQQLGIGVATTGGNLLDEAIGVGMAMARSGRSATGRGEGSSKTAVLGAGADGSLSRMGGIFGGISNMVQKGVRDYKSGANTATIAQNARKNFMQGTGIGDALKGWRDKTPAQQAQATREAAAGFATGGVIGNAIHSMREARTAARTEQDVASSMVKNSVKFESMVNGNPKYQQPAGGGRMETPNPANWSEAVRDAAKTSGMGTMQYVQAQRTAFGVGGVEKGKDRLGLNETAQKAGLSWLNNGPEVRGDRIASLTDENGAARTFTQGEAEVWNREFPEHPVSAGDEVSADQAKTWNDSIVEPINAIEGPSDVAGDFIGANYAAAGIQDGEHRDMNEAMIKTAEQSPLAAEQALMNPFNELQGNDELGDALLKSAVGEEAIAGPLPKDSDGNKQHGHFRNISAKASEDGSRLITADYHAADGTVSRYEIYNNNALTGPDKLVDTRTQLREGLEGRMQTIQTKASGEDITIRRAEISAEPTQRTAPDGAVPPPPEGPAVPPIPSGGTGSGSEGQGDSEPQGTGQPISIVMEQANLPEVQGYAHDGGGNTANDGQPDVMPAQAAQPLFDGISGPPAERAASGTDSPPSDNYAASLGETARGQEDSSRITSGSPDISQDVVPEERYEKSAAGNGVTEIAEGGTPEPNHTQKSGDSAFAENTETMSQPTPPDRHREPGEERMRDSERSTPTQRETRRESRNEVHTETVQKITIQERQGKQSPQTPQLNAEMVTISAKASNQKFQLRSKTVTQDTVDLSGFGITDGAPSSGTVQKRGRENKGSKR